MVNTAVQLEQLLRSQEDYGFLIKMGREVDRALGRPVMAGRDSDVNMMLQWSHLRKDLLNIVPGLSWAEVGKHLAAHVPQKPDQFFELHMLGMWVAHSRRIYSLDADLQLLLNTTSIDGLAWDDVRLPFDAFAISLTTPLVTKCRARKDASGIETPFDTIIVARDIEKQHLRFVVLPAKLATDKFLTASDRRQIEELARRKKWHVVEKKISNILRTAANNSDKYIVQFVMDSEFNVTQAGTPTPQTWAESTICEQVFRIVAGICMYMKTLPSSSSHVSSWNRDDKPVLNDRGHGVTDERQICTLSTEFKVSVEDRRVLEDHTDVGRTGRILTPHFRQGYWHRPRGMGHDPSAPKSEWTRPTVVNRRLRKDGELPQGAHAILH